MERDKLVGAGILLASIVVAIVYALLLYSGYGSILAVILVSVAFFALLGIVGWIGWTMATTPSIEPVRPEISSEIEAVEEKQAKA